MAKTNKMLSLNIETLRDLTPADAAKVNGGFRVSSVLGPIVHTIHKVSSVLAHDSGKMSSVMPR